MPAVPNEDAPEEGFTVRDRRGQRAEPEAGFEGTPRAAEPSSLGRPPESVPGAPPLPLEPDLAGLVLLLANSALLYLGEAPDAEGGGAPVDLAQAKFSVDLLRVLKEKTEGNRSADETRLLDGVVYDLEMRFVRAVGRR